MLQKEEILQIFSDTGVLLEGHFLLTSGLHAKVYLQCAQVMQYPKETGKLCEDLAKRFADTKIDVVVGPAIGAIVMAYEMGRALNVRAIFGEKDKDGNMQLRRGFKLSPGEKVLVVEDVVTTGGSVQRLINTINATGAEVVGVGAFVDRSGGKAKFEAPFKPLINLNVETYEPENCPLCAQKMKLVKPGSKNPIK